MNAIARADTFAQPRPTAAPDPLQHDRADDEPVVTTRRGLVRLALVASETASRFARDGIRHDPMAWMLAPLGVFDGRPAVEAVLERPACLRAVLLHGLGIELDADPAFMDALADEGEVTLEGEARDRPGRSDLGRPERLVSNPSPAVLGFRLFTAVTVHEDGTGTVHAFDAAVLPSTRDMLDRVTLRLGEECAADTRVYEGVPRGLPLVDAMLTDVMADMLEQVAAAPDSPLAHGLDVVLEQRFRS